jgi:hypothetical protein
MKIAFVAAVACAAAVVMASYPVMALQVVHGQVILDRLDDYDHCQDYDYSGDMCQDGLKRWVEAHPGDAFKAGKMTRKIMNSWVAVPLFAQAFDQKIGDCKDEDVNLSVVSALELPPDRSDDVVPDAEKIGFDLCFAEMKDALVNASGETSYSLKNMCPGLMAKNAVSGLRLAKCQEVK